MKFGMISLRAPARRDFATTKMRSNILGSIVIALCLVLLTACANKDNPLVWTEEIVMPDQRVITLKRVQYFDDEDHVAAHSFEFEHPVTKQLIKWQSDPFVAFSLVAVFLVKEELYILVKPTFGRDLERAGCPYPSMFIYRWDGAQWQQVPYKDSPLPEIRNNVTGDPKLHREHIKNSNYRIPANGVIPLTHPEDKFTVGITLQRFPTQIFQCPAQRKVEFK